MSGLEKRRGEDLQKRFPGCMGGMINIFDLSAGMDGAKLLTDRPHRDNGSPARRNHYDVKKARDPVVVQAEEKPITSEMRRSSTRRKSGGTPMKMLIAQEMSKETDSRKKPSNVVARLMGLEDTLPVCRSGHSTRVTLAGALIEDGYYDRSMPCDIHSCARQKEYRDGREVRQQPPRTSCIKNQPLQKGRYTENQSEKRMDLVREKFIEAKRLATDEKLLHSKEFQDALEVLSSNRDLFLKFLEEPNSLFSKHLKELHSLPPPPQSKRITVLKPSRTVELKAENQVKKQQYYGSSDGGGWNRHQRSSSTSQPTRIVVLKPCPGKHHDMKSVGSPHISSSELMEKGDSYQDSEASETLRSREIAKEIAWQMRDNVRSTRRDESLLSSVLSNGYVGDDSSFYRSENEYIEEEGGECSDSEIVTPTSRHSWDYANRFGSPNSLSSFSRTSYSPESSVIREAKRRLSERWASVASNEIGREQIEIRRSSSTLGEMLAISEVKKEDETGGVLAVSSSRSYVGQEDSRESTICSSKSRTKDENCGERPPLNLARSKSVPNSSSAYENIVVNLEAPVSEIKKAVVTKEVAKSKSGKSSFKGKVSSLFFSRNKKAVRDNSTPSPLVDSDNGIQTDSVETIGKINDVVSKSVIPEGHSELNSEDESTKASTPSPAKNGPKQGTMSFRSVLALEKPNSFESLSRDEDNHNASEKSTQNQDQPSPTSILDAPFEDDTKDSTPSSSQMCDAGCAEAPVDSIARSLSWDDDHLGTSLQDISEASIILPEADKEEQERFLLVQSILSTTGIGNEKLNTVFTRWHSLESPLDPTLLDKFLDRKEEKAKSRERRSNQRLLFDCVNSALLDIGRTAYCIVYPWPGLCNRIRKEAITGASVEGEVWMLVQNWFSGEAKCEGDEIENGNLVVERLLGKDIGGSRWTELMRSEIDEISKEICGEVFEQLVGEALVDFNSCL